MNRPLLLTTVAIAVAGGSCVLALQQTAKQPDHIDRPQSVTHTDQSREITTQPAPGGAIRLARMRQRIALVAQGEKEEKQGHDAQAERLFREAVAIENDGKAWLLLAQMYERQNRQAEALHAYNTLVYSQGWGGSINSDPTTLMRYVLALSRGGGRWQEAVSVFDRAQRQAGGGIGMTLVDGAFDARRPDWSGMKAAAHYVLGTRSPRHGPADPKEQLKHLESAVHSKPSWAAAQLAYGQALERAGKLTEAKAAFKRAAGIHQGG